MCLNLTKTNELFTAIEDIVVYKKLELKYSIDPNFVKHGDSVKAVTLDDCEVEGVIVYEEHDYFLCSNDKKLGGQNCALPKGYCYSWLFDNFISSAIVNGVDITKNKILTFLTYYRNIPIEIGKTYESELELISYVNKVDVIEKGLHSYKKLNDCFSDVRVECIIPKGSQYYFGTFNGKDSYASNKLTYVRIID